MLPSRFIPAFFLILSCLSYVYSYAKDPECPENIKQEFRKYENHSQLFSIAMKESSFDPDAKNGQYIGLMQISEPIWYKELIEQNIIKTRKDLKDFKYNIKAADYILKVYNYDYDRYRGKKKHAHKRKPKIHSNIMFSDSNRNEFKHFDNLQRN